MYLYTNIFKTIHVLNRISTPSLVLELPLNVYTHPRLHQERLINEHLNGKENHFFETMYDVKSQNTYVLYIYIYIYI